MATLVFNELSFLFVSSLRVLPIFSLRNDKPADAVILAKSCIGKLILANLCPFGISDLF